jgi:DNA adenine methylase
MLKPILRYPGGKWRLRKPILARLARYQGWRQYREPFVGAGAIGIAMAESHPHLPIWVNDLDIGIYCLWKTLRDHPDLLRQRVCDFVPSVEAYKQIRAYLRSKPTAACDHDVAHIGFCKLAIHCMSFSSLGLSGSPLRNIGSKWSPRHLCEKITRLQHYVHHIKITTTDYRTLIVDESTSALLYVDPPYFSTGAGLYAHAFAGYQDHVALAQALRHTPHHWVMSYDNSPQIRHLYQDWANIECLPVKYTLRDHAPATELLISSH